MILGFILFNLSISISPFDLLLCNLLLFGGAAVQGVIGFGTALITVPFLYLINPALVPAPTLIVITALCLLIAGRNVKHVDNSGLLYAVSGRIVGTGIAIVALSIISPSALGILLGLLVLFAVIMSLSTPYFKISRTNLLCAGTVSGFMATVCAIGGPPIAMLYQHKSADKIRANLSSFFIIGNIISFIGLYIGGKLTLEHFMLAMMLLPGILLGFYLSRPLSGYLNPKHIRFLILLFSTISAVLVIIEGIFMRI